MKKITLSLLCLLFVGTLFAQKKRNCYAMESLEHQKELDPTLDERMKKIESFTQRRIQELQNYQGKVEGEVIILPVVVHVLYTNSSNNISLAQINSQIDVLNADFRRTNADANNKWSQAADSQIEFRLATVDPNGNATTGITRTQVSKSTWDLQNSSTSNDMKKSSRGGVDPWNTSEYLNMWIVDNLTRGSSTILGFAQFPGGSAATDGVVMADQYFGTTGTAQAPFDGGRTTTHEVGHFLNLRHIWGDGPCGDDDFVSDTPESDAPNYNCATGHTSCGSEDMVQNYMDYSDDSCMNLFTQGQKARMRTVLEAGGSRRSLALSDKFGASCNLAAPSNLSSSNVGDNAFTVTWNAVSGASSYKVTVAGNSTTVSGTSYTASGLTAGTQYSVSVAANCSSSGTGETATTNVTTTGTTPVTYCDSKGNNVSDEYIQKVTLGTIDNSSGAGNGYSDFTSLSTNLTKGQANSITITPKWTGTVYDEGYAVFIDYNQDGDFEDSGETVWTKAKSKDTSVTGSFTVPSSATNGSTRMRVIMQYNATPSASCGAYNYGETEDYTVVIGSAAADTTAPVITLTGNSSVTIEVGGTYSEQGATATDNVDGNLTSSIVTAGNVDTNTVGVYTVTYNVSDAAGNAATQVSRTVNVVDTTAPVITLNGSSTITLTVGDSFTDPGATASDNYDGNISANITVTGSVNTASQGTYILNYNVSDAAGNTATQVSRTVNVAADNSGGGSGCTNGISSFPYSEGFENTLGAWTQSTADDIDWTLDSAGTPSNNTGPASATEGTYYVYVEASGNGNGYPNKRAILNSPCYDLSGETAATFSFKYHMYGAADMGSLAVEASSDNGATWTSVWSKTGNQGNSWETATVDLASYVGGNVQLRFNRVTGSTWQADIALDDVKLTAGGNSGGGDTTVTLSITFDNYPEETSWEIQNGSGSVVASGGTYASQADGSTLNINVDLPAGCYNLIMKDSYGDGMCCSYGNGSYTLSSGGTTLANGSSFQSTDTKNFCVGGANTRDAGNTFAVTPQIDSPSVNLKVYPNPVRSFLNISIIGANADKYEVINAVGQTVLRGSYEKAIDVARLPSGIYLLRVQTGEKSKMTKFVKQ